MKPIRFSFLPTFFTCLVVVLAVLVAVRIRSYQSSSQAGDPIDLPEATNETVAPARPTERTGIVSSDRAIATPDRRVTPGGSQDSPISVEQAVEPWIEQMSFLQATRRSGQSATLQIRLSPGREVSAVSGLLESPTRMASLPLQCSSSADRTWTCTVRVSSCVACGTWTVGRLELISLGGEKIAVETTDRSTKGRVYLIGDRCDWAPPQLHVLTVDDSGAADGIVVLGMSVADDLCGIQSITGVAESNSGQKLAMSEAGAGDEGSWWGRFQIGRGTERGQWQITSIVLTDGGGNSKSYSREDLVLKNAAFRIP